MGVRNGFGVLVKATGQGKIAYPSQRCSVNVLRRWNQERRTKHLEIRSHHVSTESVMAVAFNYR